MHIIIGTRGNKESVDLFIKEMSSKYMNLPFRNKKTGKIVNVAQAVHVRPFQMWEIIFPKEVRDIMLTTLFPDGKVQPNDPKFRRVYNWILKFLPFKKIPKKWDNSKHFYVVRNDVEIVGLGMKDDPTGEFKGRSDEQMKSIGLNPKTKWEYEML